ncbi:MAG: hypothetical protein QM786_06800 [Breznakibacter sp.]
MKKLIVLFLLFVLVCAATLNAQNNIQKDQDFKEFLSLFPKKEFPFFALWDFDERTSFSTPLMSIPKNLYQQFIVNYGVESYTEYCPEKYFWGFSALCRFPDKDSCIIIIATNDAEAGCDEKWYLLTYTFDGNLIDKLWIFGRSHLKSSDNSYTKGTYLLADGEIFENDIDLSVKRYDPQGEEDKVIKYEYKFHIAPNGRFQKIEGGKVFE